MKVDEAFLYLTRPVPGWCVTQGEKVSLITCSRVFGRLAAEVLSSLHRFEATTAGPHLEKEDLLGAAAD